MPAGSASLTAPGEHRVRPNYSHRFPFRANQSHAFGLPNGCKRPSAEGVGNAIPCKSLVGGKRSVPPSPYSAEQRDGVAADPGGEHVAEVGKERAALQAAGDRGAVSYTHLTLPTIYSV